MVLTFISKALTNQRKISIHKAWTIGDTIGLCHCVTMERKALPEDALQEKSKGFLPE
jgi:hypothetical protein